MALYGVTSPEKLIIPLFFNKKDRGELSRLFRPDSVLKHLMDEWKEDVVSSTHKEELALIKYLRSRVPLLKSSKFALLKQLSLGFSARISRLLATQDPFENHIQNAYMKQMSLVDNEILKSLVQYYAILEEHKRLVVLRADHVKIALDIKREVEVFCKRLAQFGVLVEYETWGAVNLTKLEEHNPQFSRCEKAIYDHIERDMFIGTDYSGLKLLKVFKIENSVNLEKFEKVAKRQRDCLVKGLFISVKKKHIIPAALFGMKSNEFVQREAKTTYRDLFYRLPRSFTEKSNVEGFIKASEGMKSGVWGSTSSTLEKDRRKFQSNVNCVIFLILARVLIPKNRTATEMNSGTQEFHLKNMEFVLPEYILMCSKEKNKYEIVPEKQPIIPVNLCEIDHHSRTKANIMSAHVFYTMVNKAVENSLILRMDQKSKLHEMLDRICIKNTLPSTLYSCIDELHSPLINSLRLAIEKLEKELQDSKKQTLSLHAI